MAKGGSKAKQVSSLYAEDEIWNHANSNNTTQPVGSKRPNALEVYDLNGNVQEWCQDYYHGTFYYFSPNVNPVCSTPHPRYTYGVIRGGSWQQERVKVTDRRTAPPYVASAYLGFRCVLEE